MMPKILRILIVDDSDDDICLVRDAISRYDETIIIEAACDGESALHRLRTDGHSYPDALPDLVFLDVRMPRRDGLEVLQEIRSDPVLHKLPVLMLTSLSDREWVEEGFSLGANGYLTKPVDVAGLREAIAIVRTENAPGTDALPAGERPLVFLIAEDNDDDRVLMREALEESRIPNVIYSVRDGDEAISFLKNMGRWRDAPRPDVAILDLRMPRRDGIEVIRALHNDPELRRIKSIVVTGFAPSGWIEKEWIGCADAVLNKPVSPLALRDTITSLFERTSA